MMSTTNDSFWLTFKNIYLLNSPNFLNRHNFLVFSALIILVLGSQSAVAQNHSDLMDQVTSMGIPLDAAEIDKALNMYVDRMPSVMDESLQNITLFKQAVEFANAKLDEYTELADGNVAEAEERFRQEVDLRQISYTNKELGTAEFTNIDNTPVIRIVDKMGTVIVFIHAQFVKKDSSHLQRYLSRQHSVAGKSGRDVIIVWHDDNQILNAEDHIKPSANTLSFWRGYLAAVYKPATFDSFVFGLISGFAQAALTGVMGYVKSGFTPHVAVMVASVFGFGTTIGTYSSTYRNVIFYSNSKMAQILKQSVVSFAFAYMIFSINQAALGDASHLTSFSEYIGLLLNILLSSAAKNEFSQWANVKTVARADLKNYTWKIPFINRDFKFAERDINYQLKVQLTTQSIRTADLLGYDVKIPMGSGVYAIEIGKILLWLSAPIVNYTVKKWANKNYPEVAKELGMDKANKFAVLDFFKRIIDKFNFNPMAWKSVLTNNYVDHEIRSVKVDYIKAMAKYMDTQKSELKYSQMTCSELSFAL